MISDFCFYLDFYLDIHKITHLRPFLQYQTRAKRFGKTDSRVKKQRLRIGTVIYYLLIRVFWSTHKNGCIINRF